MKRKKWSSLFGKGKKKEKRRRGSSAEHQQSPKSAVKYEMELCKSQSEAKAAIACTTLQ
jgi:hypothetical protein